MDSCKGGVGVVEAKATARKKDSEGEAREKEDKGKKEKRNVGRNRTVPEARRRYCLLGNGKGRCGPSLGFRPPFTLFASFGRFRWGCETEWIWIWIPLSTPLAYVCLRAGGVEWSKYEGELLKGKGEREKERGGVKGERG
jgi:hypothetical protein